jgi:hypothetical protein
MSCAAVQKFPKNEATAAVKAGEGNVHKPEVAAAKEAT